MAKVTGPLMSFSARGKLADTIVYFPWKGIAAVRSYVVPADTPSAAKDAQRAKITAALAEFHGAAYNAADMTAWNTLAGISAKIMSGFNRFVSEHVNEAILGGTWTRINQCVVSAVADDGFVVTVSKVSAGLVPNVRLGVSKSSMLDVHVLEDSTGNIWTYTFTGLNPATMYYFTVDVGVSGATWGRLGIYAQRTAAAA